MARQTLTRRLVFAVIALGGVYLSLARAAPGGVLKLSQNVPGDSKPVILHADDVTTWIDGSRRIFLLKGLVLVEHGVVSVRMQQGVAWVDQDSTKKTGISRIDLYAEGDVSLINGSESQVGTKALVDLSTRGEIRLKAQGGKVNQRPASDDPVYQRAVLERFGPPKPPPAPIQRTSLQVPIGDQGNPAPPNAAAPVPAHVPPSNLQQPPTPAPISPGGVVPPPGFAPPPAPIAPGVGNLAPPAAATVPGPPPGAAGAPSPAAAPQSPPAWGPPPAGANPQVPYPPPSLPNAPAPTPAVPPTPSAPAPPTLPPVPVPAPTPPANPPRTPPARLGPPRQISIVPRTTKFFQEQSTTFPNGEEAFIVTGGVIITVSNPTDKMSLLDIEADRLVVWTKGNLQQLFSKMRQPGGGTAKDIEFYLSGDVVLRSKTDKQDQTLRADELYYDVGRNVAVAYQADLEFKQPKIADPVHVKADELLQISPTLFQATRAQLYSSRLPSDPGLTVNVSDIDVEIKQVPKRTYLFGPEAIDPKTGQPETEPQRIFKGRNVVARIEDVPVLYLPYTQGDANDPLGPLQSININYNQMFGTQFFSTWDVYDLLGVLPTPGTRWNFEADYMSKRGPAIGSTFDYAGANFFDVPSRYSGFIKSYGMYDKGFDLLGGGRGIQGHPPWRGRLTLRHNQELPEDFTLQLQASGLSDKNFLEEYYYNEFNNDVNQETSLYLKQQRNNWAWTATVETRIRNWVNETQRLPQLDGYLIGQSLFDVLTYNVHGSAGYDRLMTTHVLPPPSGLTTDADNTGRFDLRQELSLPFYLGPVKMVPYGVLDLTQYTADLYGDSRGRFYGAGGMRGSLPMSQIFPSIQSDLWNLNGINHKILLSGNYYIAHSDTPFTTLPQLDRLQDDATDQSIRDINPEQQFLNPSPLNGKLLASSPLYDPQTYAIRTLLFNRIDTLDSTQVLQGDLRQRWQTKRGYPGMQHIIDWLTLDVSASYFPQPGPNNFNSPFAFVEYDSTWNVGDRTALVANGWWDPISDPNFGNGPQTFSFGAFLNRPDRTNYYIGYRALDPIGSKLLTGAASYVFSPKYAANVGGSYDVALKIQSYFMSFTRMGSDLQMSVGLNYNSTLNNFSFLFEILPNLAAQSGRRAMLGSNALAR